MGNLKYHADFVQVGFQFAISHFFYQKFEMIRDHSFYLPNVKTKRWFANSLFSLT